MNYLTTEGIYIMYLRKSRADERLEIENVLQKHEIELQILAKREIGYSIPEKYIFREIVSGSTLKDRPLIKEILKMMESGNVKGVLVVDPQRLTRGDMLDQGHIINAFKYTDTLIMTPYKTYNLNDPTGIDMKLIKMELDHGSDYLDYYKMIQKRGRLASVREGNYVSPIPPYGYKKVTYVEAGKKIKTLEPVADQADVVRMIFDKYYNGKSINQIAKELNEADIKPHSSDHWVMTTVSRLLANPVYDGKIRWDLIQKVKTMEDGELVNHKKKNPDFMIFEGKHEAIVNHDLFMAVQQKLSQNKSFSDDSTLKNPLSGILFCGQCGSIMKRHTSASKKLERGRKIECRYVCSNEHCKIKSSKCIQVIDAVVDAMQHIVNDFEIIVPEIKPPSNPKEEISSLKESLNKLNEKEETMFELLETKVYSPEIFAMRHAELEKRRQELTSEIQRLSDSFTTETRTEKKTRFTDALKALKDTAIPGKEKNNLLKTCIEKIDYNVESNKVKAKVNLDIHFKF